MSDKRGRILLVEDDKVDQMAFERFAKEEGFHYDYVITGSVWETNNILKTERFDVVVSDYSLGDGTLLDLLDEIKDMPIIVVTGTGSEEVAVQAMRAGVYDYLIKDPENNYLKTLPVTVNNVINKIRLEKCVAERTKELEQANIRLKELDRLKSMFIASMSHELRTPLNSIIGFTGIILQGLSGEINTEQRKQLGMVYGNAKHLLELINDILDLSKIEAKKMKIFPRKFDIRKVVDEAVGTVYPTIKEKGLELIIRMPENSSEIYSDRAKAEQVLINLLSNAAKFTNQGRIEVEGHLEAGGKELVVSVSDTGIGIKESDLDSIFDVFRQLYKPYEKKPEGTGLGLSISKKLVEMLGGRIWVSSQYGKGSKFSFSLPLSIIS